MDAYSFLELVVISDFWWVTITSDKITGFGGYNSQAVLEFRGILISRKLSILANPISLLSGMTAYLGEKTQTNQPTKPVHLSSMNPDIATALPKHFALLKYKGSNFTTNLTHHSSVFFLHSLCL